MKKILITSFIIFILTFVICIPVYAQSPSGAPAQKSVCDNLPDAAARQKCNACGTTAAWTAFGCVQTEPQQIVTEVLRIGVGIGGGIAFILILIGGFQILMSAGDPEKLAAGRDQATSAVTGLLLIIFSIFFLNFVGYNVFGIPGYGVSSIPKSGSATATAPEVTAQNVASESASVDDPYRIHKCEGDPSDPPNSGICHVKYDIVNSVLRPSQDDVHRSRSPLVGLEEIANMIWAGTDKPAGNSYALATNYTVPYGNQVEDSSATDLTPQGLQDITIHNTTPDLYCVTSRLCVANPQTGGLAGNFITEETWCTAADVPGSVAQNEGTQRLASYTTNYVNPSQNFTKPDLRVQKAAPPGCGERADGDTIDQNTVSTVKTNLWGQEDKTSIPYTITSDMQSESTEHDKNGNTYTLFTSKFIVPATRVDGGTLPWEGHILCNGAGCPNPDDLDSVSYLTDDQKNTLQKGGGWISDYRPDGFDQNYTVGLNAKFLAQEFDSLFVKVNTADTTIYAFRRVEEAQTFANCSLLPDGLQTASQYYPNGDCNHSWAGPSTALALAADIPVLPPNDAGIRTTKDANNGPLQCANKKKAIGAGSGKSADLSAAIAAASAWAGIPGCVLSGVADIEGASQEMAQSSCVPNQCGAAGPFQVSVGVDSCGNKTCDTCGPGWKGRACNDETWALKLAGGTAANACDVGVASKAAAAVVMGKAKGFNVPFTAGQSSFDPTNTMQKQTIITAADAYYGVPTAIPRLGGLSYGEYVYQTCLKSLNQSATYTHSEHTFPPRAQ